MFRRLLTHGERVHDCYAGTGERLGALADQLGLVFTGTELEPEFIGDPRVERGNACDASSYPAPGFTTATSPAYPNGMCLAQEHRVLTNDLRWVPVGDLNVGDELLAFDDETTTLTASGQRSRRRWQRATVTRSEPVTRECVRVILADGSEVVTTPEHPWLSWRYAFKGDAMQWVQSSDLMGVRGSRLGGRGSRQPFYVARQLDTWDAIRTYDAGWLAGMFDGEGSLTLSADGAPKMSLTQVDGPTLHRVDELLDRSGAAHSMHWRTVDGRKKIADLYVTGGMPAILKTLGQIRPGRLLDKWPALDIGTRTLQAEPVAVLAVEPAGQREIQHLSTTSRTYIGEGFLMHNSDDFNAQDGSKRRTYRAALAKILGHDRPLHVDNAGRWGYRGTPLHSTRRGMYWNITARTIETWSDAGCSRALVNVSDFKAAGRYEPVVDGWAQRLSAGGWTVKRAHKVETPRFAYGANRDERADYEVILEAVPT